MRSTLDPQEFERERLVIIEELNRRDDTPSTRTFDALYTTAYAVHPYRRPIGGSRAVIQQMTRDQLFGSTPPTTRRGTSPWWSWVM